MPVPYGAHPFRTLRRALLALSLSHPLSLSPLSHSLTLALAGGENQRAALLHARAVRLAPVPLLPLRRALRAVRPLLHDGASRFPPGCFEWRVLLLFFFISLKPRVG